ncbi:dolichyldiphosphatase 1-like isoform X1 [Dinothrombium tinctorium]|uniref:Dolichyldiphosphatase n=1 Tax=Dinothrombium tinctorium TaxID=1965070 RepID=A0A3S3QF53_9ACAR|nr:dolichyldiphosphatase 1-like isoform X1 [Dinothrombium tinctorium]RWS06882.1 dolichyldiphosphatase 1-like isoform X1 [Dinothrombium tinctorium]RWS08067.1 dolichyldiphosphatase 1-like isoform X1 [Dinothrombium tinctorium]
MNDIEWVPLSLTYVKYPKGDHFGHLLAFISLTPFAILVAYFTLCTFNRDLQTISLFFAQLSNETLNYVLKNIIKQKRPMQVLRLSQSPKTYGMPSQHTQFMGFFCVFCCLYIAFKCNRKSRLFRFSMHFAAISSLISVTYSRSFLMTRVYLLYHSWMQCIVGAAVGGFFAVLMFFVIFNFLEPNYFEKIVNW